VALDVADIEFTDDGLRVTIRRSKTDQEGQGATIAIIRGGACCPVKAVKAWLDATGISEGPIFRPVRKGDKVRQSRLTAKSVCDLAKSYAGKLGLNTADYGARSLRAGFLTSAARRGASVFKMRDVSRNRGKTRGGGTIIRFSKLRESDSLRACRCPRTLTVFRLPS
jgi:hypothetical protein